MYRNSEGYADPTAGAALSNLGREKVQQRRNWARKKALVLGRPKVYVISAFAGDTAENIKKARRYCRYVASQQKIPFASHLLYPQFLDDGDLKEREGQYGQRYYMEGTHEGIISREVFQQAQEVRQQRKNPLLVGKEHPKYPFGGLIECGECGKHFQHKINNSGKKWKHGVWVCATKLHKGMDACNCTRIKDSVLYEKFVEAYNQFVTERPQGASIEAMQQLVKELRKEEAELAQLRRQRLLSEEDYRAEQRYIKAQIDGITASINEQKSRFVRESDFTIIEEFDQEKVDKFITKVIVRRGTVTFVFYNDVEITKAYSNGKPGNKPGWNIGR